MEQNLIKTTIYEYHTSVAAFAKAVFARIINDLVGRERESGGLVGRERESGGSVGRKRDSREMILCKY